MPTTGFSLFGFIHRIQIISHVIHPDELTDQAMLALRSCTEEEREQALRQGVRSLAQHVLNGVRHSAPPPRPDPHGHTHNGHNPGPHDPDPGRTQRDLFIRAQLRRPFWSGLAGQHVPFGDLDTNALLHLVDFHGKLARANQKAADNMRRWAELLTEHNVTTIKELPEDVLYAQLSAEADAA